VRELLREVGASAEERNWNDGDDFMLEGSGKRRRKGWLELGPGGEKFREDCDAAAVDSSMQPKGRASAAASATFSKDFAC
jgi:hypothetical protein